MTSFTATFLNNYSPEELFKTSEWSSSIDWERVTTCVSYGDKSEVFYSKAEAEQRIVEILFKEETVTPPVITDLV